MAKRKKNYLPKRVGRLRIPKRVRRGVVGAAVSSAAGQAIIAALVLKAGSRLARRLGSREPARDGLTGSGFETPQSPKIAHQGEPSATRSPSRGPALNVKHAVGQAALAFILGLSHPARPAKARRRKPTASVRSEQARNGRDGAELGSTEISGQAHLGVQPGDLAPEAGDAEA